MSTTQNLKVIVGNAVSITDVVSAPLVVLEVLHDLDQLNVNS